MVNFKAWVEKTRSGNFRIRHRDSTGRKFTDLIVDSAERITIDGKIFAGKNLANLHCEKVIENFHKGKLGEYDLTMPLEGLIEKYIAQCETSGLTWMTTEHYEIVLRKIAAQGNMETLADVSDEKLRAWREKRSGELQNSTLAGEIIIMFVFCHWLIKHGHMKQWPFKDDMIPSVRRPGPKFYTKEEWDKLDASLAVMDPMARLACNLAYYAGLRKIELVGDDRGRLGVLWEDLNWLPNGKVNLMIRKEVTKGGKRSRLIRLDPHVINLLGSRKKGPIITIKRSLFWYLFSEARRKAGINPKLTVHGLRHSFSKNYLQYGHMSLSALKDALGHSSITTTQIYSAHEDSHLAEGIERAYENRKNEDAILRREGQKDIVFHEVSALSSTKTDKDALESSK